ncbi:O-methyltransferase [Enemella sp. A6]|uniref:O-methyltransferase n=1 Tax=Enemella sp. A6 TaxID=3440152 RepID=UPI003EBC47FB
MTDPNAPDAATWAFAENYVPESEVAAAAREQAKDLGVAPVGRGTASLLTVLMQAINAAAVVEVGTGSGVSGLALYAGMAPDGVLTSIDAEPQHQAAARKSFEAAGVTSRRIRLIPGDALTVLPNLLSGAYDAVFVDADKLEYVEYVEQALRLLRHGGLLLIDNALWHNRVADEDNHDDRTVVIRETLAAVTEIEEFTSSLVPVGDGLLIAVKQ